MHLVIDTSAAREVAAGIAWLDEHQPGWTERINLNRLCLSSTDECVLCQIADTVSFCSARHLTGVSAIKAVELGFASHPDLPDHQMYAWYDAAERLWRAEITRRQTTKEPK
jgi:hypothetical protein